MKTLLSLFDYSGNWSAPFAENGWDVIPWDIKIDKFMNIKDLSSADIVLELFENVDGILAAVPCSDFSNSGAQYWKAKDEDGRIKEAQALVDKTIQLIDLFRPTDPDYEGTFFWAIENPVGRLGKLYPELPKPFYFNPNDFAGWLNPSNQVLDRLDAIRLKDGIGLTQEEFSFVLQWNAYTKKTGLWGEFNKPELRHIPSVKGSPQGSPTQRVGGNGDKTKELRSFTPQGFAEAFCQANKDQVWVYSENPFYN